MKPIITNIEDLRLMAKRRVPRMFYDYADAGSWDEITYADNYQAYRNIKFCQRVGVDIAQRSTAATMLGEPVTMPVAIAPTGLTGMQHADGEIHAARAAKRFGVPFTLSTMSICSLEAVAAATDNHPFWFQLYMMRDRDFNERLIARAQQHCSVLMVTLDLQVLGQRHKDIKNGLSTPPKLTITNMVNLASKPRWCWNMLQTNNRSFGNIVGHVTGVDNVSSLSKWTAQQFDPSLSWDHIAWIKKKWGGKLILKGILDPRDAQLAVDVGADAIVVSNHGGRQLDGAPATIDVLAAIVAAVGSKVEVHIDSGIISGQNVCKALALGAHATYIGRAMLYGLGAMGEAGVDIALALIRNELDVTMGFCGKTAVDQIDIDCLWRSS